MPTPIDTGAAGTATTVVQDTSGTVNTPPAPVRKAAKKPVKKAPAAANYTAQTWAKALLTRLGAPVTSQNLQAVVSWEAAEGGHWNNTARYNPLGTTLTQPGSYVMPGGGPGADAGVQAYTSWDQGLKAAVSMLNQGNMSAIKQSLMQGNNAHAVADAVVNQSPWGTKQITIGNYATYGKNNVKVPAGEAQTGANTVTYSGNVNAGQAATPKSLSVKQYLDNPDIAAKYGFLAAYMKDPAIGPVLAAAAKNGWGENEILGALTDPKAGFPKAVKWWKKTSTTAALWQAQQNLEPGTAKERLGNMTGQVQQLAQSTLGQVLDPGRAAQIANTAIAHGWSQAQLQSAVGAEFHYNASQAAYGGLAGQTLDALRGHAADYLVPLSDQTLNQWTRGVLQGTFKDTDFQDYLKSQAESLYPTLKTALDSGVTTKQFLNPYGQLLQQTLGKNPDDINWMDPKWSKALNTTTPDGQRAPMSLSDWGSYLRSTPDYQYTDQAKQNASDLASQLVQHLGKVQV